MNRDLTCQLLPRVGGRRVRSRIVTVGCCTVAVLASCGGAGGSESYADGGKPQTAIEQAASECSVFTGHLAGFLAGNVGDKGATISFDTKGEDDTTGDSLDVIACVLGQLGATEFVVSQMDGTRALDGQQSATWDGYEAVWSYHPDSGMRLAIHEG